VPYTGALLFCWGVCPVLCLCRVLRCGWGVGFFEADDDRPSLFCGVGWLFLLGLDSRGLAGSLCLGWVGRVAFMESLILAQDERWRRA
jgi:hypothetical protein